MMWHAKTLASWLFYDAQSIVLNKKLIEEGLHGITAATVDGFQGKEKDVILLSTVRSNSRCRLGFIANPNRLCVSLSRSKRGLFIVGNGTCLSQGDDFNYFGQLLAEVPRWNYVKGEFIRDCTSFPVVKATQVKVRCERPAACMVVPLSLDNYCKVSRCGATTLLDGIEQLIRALRLLFDCKTCSQVFRYVLSLRPTVYKVEERALVRFDKFDRKMWSNVGEMEQLFVSPDPSNQMYYFVLRSMVCFYGVDCHLFSGEYNDIIHRVHAPLSERIFEALLEEDHRRLRQGVVHDAGDVIEAAAGVLHTYDDLRRSFALHRIQVWKAVG